METVVNVALVVKLLNIILISRSRRVETICNVTNLDILLRCKMFHTQDVLNFQMHSSVSAGVLIGSVSNGQNVLAFSRKQLKY